MLVAAAGALTVTIGGTAQAGPAPASSGGVIRPVHTGATINSTSGNWFGYNLAGLSRKDRYKQVAGTWTVPRATQHTPGEAEHSSTWVGIGGGCVNDGCTLGDNTLIQAGTEQDVDSNGVAGYHAWYELIPAPSIQIPLTVRPGDRVRANIREKVPGLWIITVSNLTTGKSWTKQRPYSSTHLTAEWIEETPIVAGTGGTGFAALPNLTQAHFDNVTANNVNPRLKSSERVFLAPDGTHIIGSPSLPQADGNGFGVCTWATSCAVPPNY
jgi:hypothetical protein